MSRELVLTNAEIVTRDAVLHGTVAVRDGRIAAVDTGASSLPGAVDCGGDLLIPGLIELHTDNLERHMLPRPRARWPGLNAVVAHDAEIAAAGITTVFDAVAVGALNQDSHRLALLHEMIDMVRLAHAEDMLRADHFLHLRCEVSYPTMIAMLTDLIDGPLVRLLSVMDHTPGQRQFADLEVYRKFYKRRYQLSDVQVDDLIVERREDQATHASQQRLLVVEMAKARGIYLASHDDETEAHILEAVEDGITIAEFPTRLEAARVGRAHGMAVLAGAPNLIRGESHSGNVSARDLAAHGLVDLLSSDYVPSALLHGAMLIAERIEGYDLPRAIATVTANPAASVGLDDRGAIAPGLRADLVRLRPTRHVPRVMAVWKAGERVA